MIVITMLLFAGFLVYLFTDGHKKNPALEIDISKEDIETLDVKSTDSKNSSKKSNILEHPIDLVHAEASPVTTQNNVNPNENVNDGENDRDSEDVDSTYYFDAEDVANSGSNYDSNAENDPQNTIADPAMHMRVPASDGGVQEENNNEASMGDNDGKNN